MRVCSRADRRGHHLAGRRQPATRGHAPARWSAPWPATSRTTSGGRRPGSSRRCSRRARSPATSTLGRRYVDALAPLVWTAAERARLRRRRAGDAPPGGGERARPATPTASSSSGRAACATSSSRSSCCSSCTAAATTSSAAPPRCVALEQLSDARVRRPGRRRRARPRLPVPAHDGAPHPAVPAAPHPRRARRTRPTCAGSPASMGFRRDPARRAVQALAAARARGAPAAREALLPPAAQRGRPAGPRRGAADARGGRRPGSRRSATRDPRGRAAPPRGADLGGQPARGDPADAAARSCSAGSPRRRTRTPACSRSGRCRDALGATHWYLGLLRDERRRRRAAGHGARLVAGTPPTCCCARPRRWRCSADDGELGPRGRAALLAEVLAAAGRNDDPAQAVAGVRAVRRRELFRTAVADLLGVARRRAGRARADRRRPPRPSPAASRSRPASVESGRGGPLPTRMAVDRDGPLRRRTSSATAATPTCCSCTTRSRAPTSRTRPRPPTRSSASCAGCSRLPGPDPQLVVDADLRRRAATVRSCARLASYAAYYERWSLVWESQALLRAEPVAGDARAGGAVRRAGRPAALPAGRAEPTPTCARSAGSRPGSRPSGCPAAPTRPCTPSSVAGGLADVEWTVQLLQLQARRRAARAAHHADAGGAAGGGGRRAARPRRRDHPGAGMAAGVAGSATRSCWSAAGPRTPSRPTRASSRLWRTCWATLRAGQGSWSRTTCGPHAGPAPWSRGSSTRERT